MLKGSVQKPILNIFEYKKDYKDIEKHRKDRVLAKDIPCPKDIVIEIKSIYKCRRKDI